MLETTPAGASHTTNSTPVPQSADVGAHPPKKQYRYVRVRLCMEDGTITTISLNPTLVERATKVLGSEAKVREIAHNAAMEYVEGKSPARTRSNYAARALQRLLLEQPRAA